MNPFATYCFIMSLDECVRKKTDIGVCHSLKFEDKKWNPVYKKKESNGSSI